MGFKYLEGNPRPFHMSFVSYVTTVSGVVLLENLFLHSLLFNLHQAELFTIYAWMSLLRDASMLQFRFAYSKTRNQSLSIMLDPLLQFFGLKYFEGNNTLSK